LNFVVWGLYFAVLLLLEKFVLKRILNKIPSVFGTVYMLLAVVLGWVLFSGSSLSGAWSSVGAMFGSSVSGFASAETLYYLRKYAVPLIVAAVGSTKLPKLLFAKAESSAKLKPFAYVAEQILIVAALIICTAFLADGSFNPFIYGEF